MKGKRKFILTAIFILLILVSSSASAETLHVRAKGSAGEYSSLQKAINAASEGDTIVVHQGRYCENVLIDKPLTIIAESSCPKKTIVIPQDSEIPIFYVTSDSVNISGFTFNGTESTYGIYLNGVSKNNISNNHFSGNWRSIVLNNSHGNSLENNYLFNSDDGIWLENSDMNLLKNNNADSNKHYGFYLNSSENNTLQNNRAFKEAIGIYMENSSGCRVLDSDTSNNFYGIYLTGSGESLLENNTANSN